MLKIELDDPHQYEEKALSMALAFFKDRSAYFEGISNLSEFLATYCLGQSASKAAKIQQWAKVKCEACQQELNGEKQWQEHVKTRKHKNKVQKG